MGGVPSAAPGTNRQADAPSAAHRRLSPVVIVRPHLAGGETAVAFTLSPIVQTSLNGGTGLQKYRRVAEANHARAPNRSCAEPFTHRTVHEPNHSRACVFRWLRYIFGRLFPVAKVLRWL
jgi:hypothetical protein